MIAVKTRCLILAASPSMDKLSGVFESLSEYFTIGVSEWASTTLPLDAYVINHTIDFSNGTVCTLEGTSNIIKVLESPVLKIICDSIKISDQLGLIFGENTYCMYGHQSAILECVPPLSTTIRGMGSGTVTRCALDLALHLGYTDITIVGFDLSPGVPGYSHRLTPFRINSDDVFGPSEAVTHAGVWRERLEANPQAKVVAVSPYGPPGGWAWFPHRSSF